jgi:small subunit ribosomal protein S20
LPTTKTAEKEMRTAERRAKRNQSVLKATKTQVTKAEGAIASGNLELAQAEVKIAIRSLDKEAESSTVHSNNSARRKSRLMKKLNAAAKAAKPVKAAKTTKAAKK